MWHISISRQPTVTHKSLKASRVGAKARFETTRDANTATLHDALAEIILGIRSHDEDIAPLSSNDDHDKSRPQHVYALRAWHS